MHAHVFVAGTFDHLHRGHEKLLREAVRAGKKVTVGLTSNAFVAAHKPGYAGASYEKRHESVATWLAQKGYAHKATIIAIDDPYEPAASDPSLDALVVTAQNRPRGMEINAKRSSRGLSSLVLLEVPIVAAQDTRDISSTRIRNGEIDKKGNLVLPDSLRPELQQPLGRILTNKEQIKDALARNAGVLFITCGDVATKTLLNVGVVPTLAIVDWRVERKPYIKNKKEIVAAYPAKKRIVSGPGYIARAAVDAISAWGGAPMPLLLEIDGEEDLLTIPALASAPVGSVLYYGQPAGELWACGPIHGGGLVEVVVTPQKKKEAEALLTRFTTASR
jgi:pantetheine-phosphate adenylyltransferase